VILSGDEAWKCRRPRQTGFADLTRAHLRRAACAAELQLNRRFCPEVYLGLAALLVGGDGRAELVEVDTPGVPLPHDTEPIEWVIRMKRLAAARFLDAALDSGRLDPEGVHRIAMRLSTLHARAPVSSIEPCDFAERFAAEIRTGAEVLGEWAGSAAALLSDRAWSLRGALEIRVREAAVIDGHGDLRPEHLSIGDEVRLIDALDCDARLRQLDPWEELSLLALMADERGAAWFGPLLARTYESGVHRPPPDLLAFYCAYHAFTRSRLAFDHLRRNPRQRVHHWGRLTRRFMRMTEAALQGWSALGEIR
jgi:aminoglycoside phosphotransferase family enzyme